MCGALGLAGKGKTSMSTPRDATRPGRVEEIGVLQTHPDRAATNVGQPT